MNLPKLPFGQKKVVANHFLTLIVNKEDCDAVIFEEISSVVKVAGHQRIKFDDLIDNLSEEKLLEYLDKAVSGAEASIPESIKTQKTVFGVDPSWVEGGKIKKDYLLMLKKISDELELTPVGFIVTTEAISHLLQKEEGAPVSAILTQIGEKYLTATVLRGGRVVEYKTKELFESPAKSLDELLKHLTSSEVLPTRIVVFGNISEETSQEFVGFSWSKTLPFLHLPQIKVLDNYFDSKSILYGAATQMNFSVSDIDKLKTSNDIEELPITSGSEAKSPKEDEGFGFQENTDVKPSEETKAPEEPATQSNENETIGSAQLENAAPIGDENLATLHKGVEEIPEEMKIQGAEKKSLPLNALALFTGFKKTIPVLLKNLRLSKIKSLPLPPGKGRILILPGFLVIILLLFILYFIFGRSAIITIDVAAKSASKTANVTFSTQSPTDIDSSTIKSDFVSVSEDGKISTAATGKKETGDQAHGTVTLFNNNDSSKSLTAGTVITSSNDLNFTLDKSVSIASQSGDEFSGTKPGTANVSVTASKFGTEYNLPSNTKFTVTGTSAIVAKNDDAFSGGTKKNITVVDKKDLDKLTSDIVKNLQSKASEDIKKQVSKDKVIVSQFLDTSFDLKSFSKKAGDAADSVSLTATVSFKTISYSKNDLNDFATKLFQKDLNGNLEVNSADTNAQVASFKKKGDSDASAKLTIETKLFPKIDSAEIANSVKGKGFDEAKNNLSNIDQLQNVSIKFSPDLFFFPKVLPTSQNRIKVVVNKNG